MKAFLPILLLCISAVAHAQSAEVLYDRACGPKTARFQEQLVKDHAHAAPEAGKALVYFIQDTNWTQGLYITRIGLDGAWAGVLKFDSYFALSVAPGEHHACAATRDRNHPKVRLIHFTAEAGKVYYYIVSGILQGSYSGPNIATMEFGPVRDSDEALYLIGSDPKSIATPKP